MVETKKFGDPMKIPQDKYSARSKRGVLNDRPPDTYKKGGTVKGAGAAKKGLRPARFT